MTNDSLIRCLSAWSAYQDNMRPETRNDFLRAYAEYFDSIGDASDRKDEVSGAEAEAKAPDSASAIPSEISVVEQHRQRNADDMGYPPVDALTKLRTTEPVSLKDMDAAWLKHKETYATRISNYEFREILKVGFNAAGVKYVD